MTKLAEKQFEILPTEDAHDGFVFGIGASVSVNDEGFDPGENTWITQDGENTRRGVVGFGRDVAGAREWIWESHVDQIDAESAVKTLESFSSAWSPSELVRKPGEVTALRYRVAGRDRRVYGRPRRFAAPPTNLIDSGFVPVTHDFQLVDTHTYDDIESNVEIPYASGSTGLELISSNMVPNPSFEVNTAGWAATPTITLNRVSNSEGGWAMRLTASADGPAGPHAVSMGYNLRPVTPGKSYTVSARIRASAGSVVEPGIRWRDAANAILPPVENPDDEIAVGWAFDRKYVTAVAPPGAAWADEMIFHASDVVNGNIVDVDEVMFHEGVELEDYFDGDTPDSDEYVYTWSEDGTMSQKWLRLGQSGFVLPAPMPLVTQPDRGNGGEQLSVSGTGRAYPIIRFNGPWTNPVFTTDDWTIKWAGEIGANDWVEIDTRPWRLTVLRKSGASAVDGLDRQVWLEDCWFAPGSNPQISLGGVSPSGSATATVRWRNTWKSY